eukprot:5807866-Alexandrium_andersonii.AAC.1
MGGGATAGARTRGSRRSRDSFRHGDIEKGLDLRRLGLGVARCVRALVAGVASCGSRRYGSLVRRRDVAR